MIVVLFAIFSCYWNIWLNLNIKSWKLRDVYDRALHICCCKVQNGSKLRDKSLHHVQEVHFTAAFEVLLEFT